MDGVLPAERAWRATFLAFKEDFFGKVALFSHFEDVVLLTPLDVVGLGDYTVPRVHKLPFFMLFILRFPRMLLEFPPVYLDTLLGNVPQDVPAIVL